MFCIWANLIKTCTNFNKGKMHASSNTIWRSQRCLLVCTIIHNHFQQSNFVLCHVSFCMTQHGNPLNLHIAKDLFPVASMTLASFVNSKCRLGECAKYACNLCKKLSMHFTTCITNKICSTRFIWCAMEKGANSS
jgi:hypothetical protein